MVKKIGEGHSEYKTFRCNRCRKRTEHKPMGFANHNRRYECYECGLITGDGLNEF